MIIWRVSNKSRTLLNEVLKILSMTFIGLVDFIESSFHNRLTVVMYQVVTKTIHHTTSSTKEEIL